MAKIWLVFQLFSRETSRDYIDDWIIEFYEMMVPLVSDADGWYVQEEKLKDKPGYEHLNEPLHILLEAEFPEDIINARLEYAVGILEGLLKPVVRDLQSHGVSFGN